MTEPTTPRPGLTACGLCAGETLGEADDAPGGQRGRLTCLEQAGLTRVTFVDCLDECERGDVVVVRPARVHRDRGASPVWFERLAGDEATGALEHWLRAGGPGAASLPERLREHVLVRDPSSVGTQPAGDDTDEDGPIGPHHPASCR